MNPANLLSWHSKYSKVIQLHINIPIFLISNRDAIVQGNGYHLPDRNAFLISTRSILTDTCQHCDIPKTAKGVVRMDTESIFYVQLVKSDVISFKMIGKDDLKLKYLPTPLLNYISQGHMPFDLLKSVHRTIRNFEGSEWEEMIKERGTYYKEIEDKVLVTLENWEKEGGDINNASLQVGNSVNNRRDTMEEEIPTNTIHYAECKEQNNVYSLNDESKSMRPGYIGMLLIMITAVIGTLLYSLAYREMNILHDTVLKHIHEMSDTTRRNILLTILVMLIPLLFMIRWRRKRSQKNNHEKNTDKVDDNDEGYNDFLRMLADKGTDKGQQDEAIDDISQLSEITSSPRSSPKRVTKLIPIPRISTTHSNSPSKKLRKRDRVLKGIKKAASLPILDIGKKKKNG